MITAMLMLINSEEMAELKAQGAEAAYVGLLVNLEHQVEL